MANTTVFVDDAVTGRLPGICAKDGVPTNDRLALRRAVGDGARLGAAWLLVLAGPLGWLALVFIASSRRGQAEQLAVQVPFSEAAYQRLQLARTQVRLALLATGAVFVLMLVTAGTVETNLWPAFIVLGLAGLVAIAVTQFRSSKAGVDVALDASRRWVTFFGVHPAFAEACRQAGAGAGAPGQ